MSEVERFDAYYGYPSCRATGRHIHANGEYVLAADYDVLATELARVKAESLRVVKDGEALKSEDAHAAHNFILHDGIVCSADYTTYGWVQADGFVADVYNDTIVQPVRLERWEDE